MTDQDWTQRDFDPLVAIEELLHRRPAPPEPMILTRHQLNRLRELAVRQGLDRP